MDVVEIKAVCSFSNTAKCSHIPPVFLLSLILSTSALYSMMPGEVAEKEESLSAKEEKNESDAIGTSASSGRKATDNYNHAASSQLCPNSSGSLGHLYSDSSRSENHLAPDVLPIGGARARRECL